MTYLFLLLCNWTQFKMVSQKGKDIFLDNFLDCTILLSPCIIGKREFESDYHHCTHFLAIELFPKIYFGYNLGAVSLSSHMFELNLYTI